MGIVVPEIFSEAINSKMGTSLRIGRIAFDATEMVPDIRNCGNKVNFPTFDRIGDAEVVTKGTELVPTDVSMTDNEAEIKQVGKSVRIFDKDAIQVKGQVIDNMAEQLGDSMAKAVDGDLVVEMDANTAYKTPMVNANSITAAEIESGFDVFGDDIDDETFAGIIINSRLRKSFLAMEEFTKADLTYSKDGNGIAKDGVIGYWHGIIPVIVCNNNTYDTTASESKTYIVKKNALGIIWQKEASTEEERLSKLFATDLTAGELYAVKLINSKGVSILRKTVS